MARKRKIPPLPEGSGVSVYTWSTEDPDFVTITEEEDGKITNIWAWDKDKPKKVELAQVFWDTLISETHKRGDLAAKFIRKG